MTSKIAAPITGLRLVIAACALAIACTSPARSDTNLVVNGGFETGDTTGWTDSLAAIYDVGSCGTDATCQAIVQQELDNVKWLTTNPWGATPYAGNYFATAQNQNDELYQTLATTAGITYQLSFAVTTSLVPGAGANAFVAVFWNGQGVATANDPNSPWTLYTMTVTGTGSDTLGFEGQWSGLDAVSVTAAVPEPATWAMMLLGFAGLGFAFRQSRRKVAMA
jgi:hypothetical protein